MFFGDIPDSNQVKTQLIERVNRGQLPHAQIFIGSEGTSKLALALALSQYILCENRGENDACGSCRSCVKSAQLKHPDLHITFPVVKKDGKKREETTSIDFMDAWRDLVLKNPYTSITDFTRSVGGSGAPNINTRECNDMIRKLGMRSFESPYKIQLIWLPEYLGKEGNRLLKLIEEPTDNTFIMLIAEHQEKILGTVLSRCQIVNVGPMPIEVATSFLANSFPQKQQDAIQQAVQTSDGNVLAAMHMLDGVDEDFSETLLSWMRLAYKLDFAALQDWTQALYAQGADGMRLFADFSVGYLREYTFYANTGLTTRLSASQQKTMPNMAKIMTIEKVESTISLLESIKYDIQRNVNPRIAFTAASIKLSGILRGQKQLSLLD